MDEIRLPLWVYNYTAQNDFMKQANTRLLPPIPEAVPSPYAKKINNTTIQTSISLVTSKTADQRSIPMAVSSSTISTGSSSPSLSSDTSKTKDRHERQWKLEIRTQLDQLLNAPKRTPHKLIETLALYRTARSGDWSTLPSQGRLEILSTCEYIVDLDFWRAWAADSNGLPLLEAWLRGSVHAHKEAAGKFAINERVLVALLQVLKKIPFTVQHLITYKFGSQVKKIAEEALGRFSPDAKGIAKQLVDHWRQSLGLEKRLPGKVAEGVHAVSTNAKRSNTHLTQQEPDNVKKAKHDNKPTDIRPSIQKGLKSQKLFAVPAKKPEALGLHSTNTMMDPFAEAMRTIQKGKEDVDFDTSCFVLPSSCDPKKPKKNRKSVTFAPDDKLCEIKIVERLVYHQDDDANENYDDIDPHFLADIRQMDANEGRHLHSAEESLQEEVDWSTSSEGVPQTVQNLEQLNELPSQSLKAETKDLREKRTWLSENYTIETTEASHKLPTDPPSDVIRRPEPEMMKLGGELLIDLEVQRVTALAHPDLNAPDKPGAVTSNISPHHNVALTSKLSASAKPAARLDRREDANPAPCGERLAKTVVASSILEPHADRRPSASTIVSDRTTHDKTYRYDREKTRTNPISQNFTFRDWGPLERLKEFPRRSCLPDPMSSSRELRLFHATTPQGSNACCQESWAEKDRKNDHSVVNHSARSTANDRSTFSHPTRGTENDRSVGTHSTRRTDDDRRADYHTPRRTDNDRRADYHAPRRPHDRYERSPPRFNFPPRSYTSQRPPDPRPASSKAYSRNGEHIRCKWWPDCRLGNSCAYVSFIKF
ncbi:hypothetical protein DFH28DRAFT_896800 [Melampsora americana]|nr:hypothetical protein DFH28DRAFT_896800 [Melampsora americana]